MHGGQPLDYGLIRWLHSEEVPRLVQCNNVVDFHTLTIEQLARLPSFGQFRRDVRMFNLRIDSYKPTKYQRELVILRSDGDEIIVTNSTLSNSLERAPYGHLAHAVLPHLYRVQARLVDRFDTEYLMIPSSPRQWLLHVMVQARAPSITLEPEELMDVLTSFSEQPHRRSKSKASEYEIHPN